MKLSHTGIHRPRHLKRWVIGGILVIILAGLGTYGTFSYLEWHNLDLHSSEATISLKTSITTVLGQEKMTGTVPDAIDGVVSDFTKKYGANPCQVNGFLYSWQTILPALKTIQDSCNTHFASALEVIATLKPLSQFMKDQKTSADLIITTTDETKATTDYPAASTAWKELADSSRIPTNSQFASVKDKLKEVATSISEAFTAIKTASDKEDKAAFTAAVNSLDTAYGSIATISTTAQAEETHLTSPLIASFEKL